MSQNGIAHLSTKRAKQLAKLNLAAYDRQQQGNQRCAFDITELPTQYTGTGQALIDNPNSTGLLLSRPWVNLTSGGIYQYHYNGYWNADTTYMTTNTPTGSQVANNFTIASEASTHSEWFLGYIRPDYTGSWTFTLTADDSAMLWIGPNAVYGYTSSNALISSTYVAPVTGSINLTNGVYYPIMIMYGNGPAGGNLRLQYAHTGQSITDIPSGMLFYNPVTNGI